MALYVGIDGTKKEIKELYTSVDGALKEIAEMKAGNGGVLETIFAKIKAVYVAVGNSGTIVTSRDGITWEQRTSGVATNLLFVQKCGDQWVAGGENRTLLISDDGVEWEDISSSTGLTVSCHHFTSIAYAQGKGFVLGVSKDSGIWTSLGTMFQCTDAKLSTASVWSRAWYIGSESGTGGHTTYVGYDTTNERFLALVSSSVYLYIVSSASGTLSSWGYSKQYTDKGTFSTYDWGTGNTGTITQNASNYSYLTSFCDYKDGYFAGQIRSYTEKGADLSSPGAMAFLSSGSYKTICYNSALSGTVNTILLNAAGIYYVVGTKLYRNAAISAASSLLNTFGYAINKMDENDERVILVGTSGKIYTCAAPLSASSSFMEVASPVTAALTAVFCAKE